MLDPLQAAVLGLVEGLTEFLPVSSTGHLILTARLLDLDGEAVKTFEIVIQSGALGAVLLLYRARLAGMVRGLLGRQAEGRILARNLLLSFLPAAIVGLALHRAIKTHLFSVVPVVLALAAGGVFMIGVERWLAQRRPSERTLESLTTAEALIIGCAQCASLWPGTSRAMVTIVAGRLVGLPAPASAEYSFLLAVPTLGAATAFDAFRGGRLLMQDLGGAVVLCGFLIAAVSAALAIQAFVRYLTRRGLEPFGWYRIGLALTVWAIVKG